MENAWASEQMARYCEAAQKLREAAEKQSDLLLATHYREIADRYEKLAGQCKMFASGDSDEATSSPLHDPQKDDQ